MTGAFTTALTNRRATIHVAQQLAPHVRAADLVVLGGPLGSGKTFFVRALCRALGLPDTERVTSPTFALLHEYLTSPPVVHADLYRLKTARELSALGLRAMRDEGRLLLVEWGVEYQEELGGDALRLEFSVDPRSLTISASGQRSEQIVHALRSSGPSLG
jgi:tRNA threonylcarbamoyladenosine biosynthesis protein TsaE